MDAAMEAMDGLVEYEIAEVTAAATYYMAEIYFDFSRSLAESGRPTDLKPADMAGRQDALREGAVPVAEKRRHLPRDDPGVFRQGGFDTGLGEGLRPLP